MHLEKVLSKLHDAPIRRKLAVAILMASLVAVVIAGLAVLIYEMTTFRPRTLEQLNASAEVLELIMKAPLDFGDRDAASENLQTLSTVPRVRAACVYTADGRVFAQYPGAGTPSPPGHFPPMQAGDSHRFAAGFLRLARAVEDDDGQAVGSIYIEYALPPFPARLPQYGIMFSVVLLALASVSLLVSRATQRLVVAPIWELSSTAVRVTLAKDYSVRATVRDGDEIGTLTQSFNDMLDTIEENVAERHRAEEALREYSQQLEERVAERTQELRTAQERLLRQERLAFLGQLAGGLSHELRRPLATIGNAIYYIEILQEEQGDEADGRIQENVDVIRNQINTMQKLIHDLLDSLRIRPETIGEIDLVEWIAEVLESHPPPEGIVLSNTVAADLPTVRIDAAQIRQVISNLVLNAYQAMPEGGELRVSATPSAAGTTLHLSDTGCGISEENLKAIFDPLFTTKSRGIGLGLTISKNFVEANGGRLEVESVDQEGTTFHVFFPSNPPPHLQRETSGE